MLITKDLVMIPVEGSTKEDILKTMASKAAQYGRVTDEEVYIQAVLKREEEYSTAVGFGVAIPHGKTDAVSEPFFMYGRVKQVDWSALDGEPVDHVFMIGVPNKDAGSTHLQILAKLSRKLMKKEFRAELSEAKSAEDMIQVLEKNELV